MKTIPLTKGKVAVVDDEDYDWLMKFKWCYTTGGYAVSRMGGGKRIYFMHRVIMGAQDEEEIDHRNRDGLYNIRANLRFCTHAQNIANKSNQATSKTGYRGVDFHTSRGKFRARIVKDDKPYFIGRYNTAEQAALAYNEKAKELFGEFAFLNIIPQESP